ncbi:hypothetical protein CHISP_2280 [Chitinispirillum alkaliphilum]|nr:hypothetical protein CHISP_2280 [Chitinispirillum alkaliphilum]
MINNDLKKLNRFISARKRGALMDRALRSLLIHISWFLITSSIFGILFSIYPWTYFPLIWTASTAAISISLFLRFIIAIFFKPSHITVAKLLEDKEAHSHPLLSVALEVSAQNNDDSPALRDMLFSRAAEQIAIYKNTILRKTSLKHSIPAFVLLGLTSTLYHILPHKISDYWSLPAAMIGRTEFSLSPGTVTVAENSSVVLKIEGPQGRFPSANLHLFSGEGRKQNEILLRPDSAGGFSFKLDSLRETFLYSFSLGRETSPKETVYVARPPQLRSLQITVTPPSYTNRSQQKLPMGQGNFSAFERSTADVMIESSALKEALLIQNNDTLQMDIDKNSAAATFQITSSGSYTFVLTDSLNQTSDSLTEYRISIIPDEPPLAFILSPAENKDLTPSQVETILVEGVDDIGIRDMRLQYCRSGECDENVNDWVLNTAGNPPVVQKQLTWEISEQRLYPGDTLFYWLRVRDNKPFGAPQVAYSDTFWFRIPTFEEIRRQSADRDKHAEQQLRGVRERQRDLSDMLEQVLRDTGGEEELSWDQERILEDLEKQLKSQADSLQSALDSLQKSMEQLREDGVINSQLSEKMEQVKKAIEDLIKEFGENLFSQFDEQNEELSFRDMKQAIDNLKEMMPELSERLDLTMQFLEMLRKDKELAALAEKAGNLSSEQAQLSEEMSEPRFSEQQQNLLERIDSFQEELTERFSDSPGSMPCTESLRDLSEKMSSAMQSGEAPSQESMDNMSRELMSMSSQLSEMLSTNMSQQFEKDYSILLSMLRDVLNLSDWQRRLEKEGAFKVDDPWIAREQQSMSNALRLSFAKSDSISSLPPQLLEELGQGYRRADEAARRVVSSLSTGDGTAAMRRCYSVLDELANSILQLLDLFDEDQGGGDESGGSGGMPSMRELSGRQAALNSLMSELLEQLMRQGDGTGGHESGLSSEELQKAKEDARNAQKAIADELERLAEQYGEGPEASARKRIEELEKEARRLAELMRNPPPEIVEQQDRLLSRMLQSALSVHRRDEVDEDRKGTRAQTIYSDREIPPPGDIIHNPDSYYLLRRKALDDNFPESYRESIRAYFDSLGEMFLGDQ